MTFLIVSFFVFLDTSACNIEDALLIRNRRTSEFLYDQHYGLPLPC